MGPMLLLRRIVGYVPRIRAEIVWVAVGQVGYLLGTAVGIKVLTNILGAAGYGKLAIGLTFAGLLNLFAYGPLSQAVLRFFSICRERSELSEFLVVIRQSHLAIGIAVAVSLVVGGGVTYFVFGKEWAAIVLVAFMFGLSMGINATLLGLMSALRDRKTVALYQAGDALLRPLTAVLVIFALGRNGLAALGGFAIASTIITVLLARKTLRNPTLTAAIATQQNPAVTRALRLEFWRYSSPFIAFASFAAISMYGDRWLLQQLFGSESVGIYAAIYQIASAPVVLLVNVVTQLVAPIVFERAGTLSNEDQKAASSHMQRATVMVTSAVLIGYFAAIYFVSEPLVHLFTTADFAIYHHLMWVLTVGVGFFQIGQIMVLKGFYHNRPGAYILPKALQAISFMVCIVVLGKNLGINGIASSVVISSVIYAATVALVNHAIHKQSS